MLHCIKGHESQASIRYKTLLATRKGICYCSKLTRVMDSGQRRRNVLSGSLALGTVTVHVTSMETPPKQEGGATFINIDFSPTTPFYLVPGHSCSAKGCRQRKTLWLSTQGHYFDGQDRLAWSFLCYKKIHETHTLLKLRTNFLLSCFL